MFHESTQKSLWFFESFDQLAAMRDAKFENLPSLSAAEEVKVVLYYDKLVREFCDTCDPPIPRPTMATACAYLKRLYLRNSIVEFPIEQYHRTCVYLACKVDEFNLTSDDFVKNFERQGKSKPEARGIMDQIISTELKLISLLQFSLVVHSPSRPLEGFYISIKDYFINLCKPDNIEEENILADIESLKTKAESFLLWSLATDVCFIFTPSQIALAAIYYSSRNAKVINIVQFLEYTTNRTETPDVFEKLMSKLNEIVGIVKSLNLPTAGTINSIMMKVEEVRKSKNSL